jgi:anti-sigma-K factor RskA
MSHEEYKEMLAEYALGVLDESEARALEQHLSTCVACRAELAAWHDTASALAFSAGIVEPSPALRSRLLESISATTAQSSINETQSRRASLKESPAPTAAAARTAAAATNVIPMPERARPRLLQRFGALAAALLFGAFLITLVVIWNRNRAMQTEMTRLARDLQTTQEQLKHEREISEMFTAVDTRVATLTGTEMAPRAHARLAYNKAGSAMMIVERLPPAPAGMDYQIWFIADGKPMPGGVFKPDATGHAEMRDQVPAAAQKSAAAFAITLEPQGGTLAPTGQKYLLSTASS